MVNRENVLMFAQIAIKKVHSIALMYTLEERSAQKDYDDVSSSDNEASSEQDEVEVFAECHDGLDCADELQKEESVWIDFFYYCIEMAALHLNYLVEAHWTEVKTKVQT